MANGEENFGVSRDDLFVYKINADEAPTRKWRRFGARGRFKPWLRRSSHITDYFARARIKRRFMGRKVHPIGFRLKINRTWEGRWYAEGSEYVKNLQQDFHFAIWCAKKPSVQVSRWWRSSAFLER